VLGQQLETLGARQVRVVQAEVLPWLSGSASPFDIVFLDPPFRRQLLTPCIQQLESRGWLSDQARIYIEAEKGLVPELPENWELLRSKVAGQVGYHLAGRSRIN
jgi:16S rRNA (guanine966-N2)-methyltransferase